jgi:hypothetical protein
MRLEWEEHRAFRNEKGTRAGQSTGSGYAKGLTSVRLKLTGLVRYCNAGNNLTGYQLIQKSGTDFLLFKLTGQAGLVQYCSSPSPTKKVRNERTVYLCNRGRLTLTGRIVAFGSLRGKLHPEIKVNELLLTGRNSICRFSSLVWFKSLSIASCTNTPFGRGRPLQSNIFY